MVFYFKPNHVKLLPTAALILQLTAYIWILFIKGVSSIPTARHKPLCNSLLPLFRTHYSTLPALVAFKVIKPSFGKMTLTTILRGFKVPLRVLDAFLVANGIDYETERLCAGFAPLSYNDDDQQSPNAVAQLLRTKAGDADKTQLFMPYKMGFDLASHAYIAYDWIMVFAQRRIKPDELPETPPPGFEKLRRDILSHAGPEHPLADEDAYQNALYIVSTDERTYVPQELRRRQLVFSIPPSLSKSSPYYRWLTISLSRTSSVTSVRQPLRMAAGQIDRLIVRTSMVLETA